MIIANPIYDVVFKYLLEDSEIACGLLSTIIGEEIETLTLQPQEIAVQKMQAEQVIRLLRLDFKAVIKTQTGETKMVLIELQKVRKLFDIMRFRNYLGENYRTGAIIVDKKGEKEEQPIPIITIYFLGFKLNHLSVPVIKVNRVYTDANTGKPLVGYKKEPFIENLTHDAYVIQIPYLGEDNKTQLEKVLRVFNQKFKKQDSHHFLNYSETSDDPLVRKIVDRLNRAVANEETQKQMNLEDEINKVFGKIERQLEEKTDEIDALEDKLEEKLLQLNEKSVQLEEQSVQLEEKSVQLEEKSVQLNEKSVQLNEKSVQLNEKSVQLEESKKENLEKDQEIETLRKALELFKKKKD